MKTVCICIPTWPIIAPRFDSFVECVARLREYVMASRHSIKIVASSESHNVPNDLHDKLLGWCNTQGIPLRWQIGGNDLGKNMNAAMDMGRGLDYVCLCQDDMWFNDYIDLSPLCDFLDAKPDYALVRFGWAHTTFLGPIAGYPLQDVNMAGMFPYADETSLWRGNSPWRFVEGVQHGGQEGEMSMRLMRAGARIAATIKPHVTHGSVPSTIEERRPK